MRYIYFILTCSLKVMVMTPHIPTSAQAIRCLKNRWYCSSKLNLLNNDATRWWFFSRRQYSWNSKNIEASCSNLFSLQQLKRRAKGKNTVYLNMNESFSSKRIKQALWINIGISIPVLTIRFDCLL